jgi:hypothetical protein
MTRLEYMRACEVELERAREKHPRPFSGPDEAMGVFLEELDEFWAEVKKQFPDERALLKELVQVGAMCLRTQQDLGTFPLSQLYDMRRTATSWHGLYARIVCLIPTLSWFPSVAMESLAWCGETVEALTEGGK